VSLVRPFGLFPPGLPGMSGWMCLAVSLAAAQPFHISRMNELDT
jgi:hypothetical protein